MFCWWLKEKRSELIHVFTKREKLAVSPLGGWGDVGGVVVVGRGGGVEESATLWGAYSLCVLFPFELVRDKGDKHLGRND